LKYYSENSNIIHIYKWKNENFPTFFCRQGMGKIVGKENIASKVAIIHKKVLVKFGYK
jgi:hypothetical protein